LQGRRASCNLAGTNENSYCAAAPVSGRTDHGENGVTRPSPPGIRIVPLLRRFLAILLLSATGANAQETIPALYEFHPPAGWVDVAVPEYAAPDPVNGIAGGALNLLYDRQINVTEDGDEYYRHHAVKVVNAIGVEDQSQIGITIDPTYQSLHIHLLRVVRGDDVIDQRDLARITTLPEETERRNRIYNGNYNIDVLLSDVRAGDVIEYAYTLFSREQLFPGHFSTRLSTAWSSPLHRQRVRIRSPVDRPLRYRLSDSEVTPPERVRGNVREFVLERTAVAAIPADRDRPNWHEPWPYFEASDLESWSAAADLIEPLFAPRRQGSTKVAGIAEEIRDAGGTLEEQALRALQYVQEKIRYTSISIGRGSHEPADPDTVLQRRFGDCKDKSLLLVTILDHLDIDAGTALVHTSRTRALDHALPTPYAFNHAIVRAKIGDEEYWLDPTDITSYSSLSPKDPADYERALLTDGSGTDLDVIPRPAPDTRQSEVTMVFDLKNGIEAPATLEMTTVYRGRRANSMRRLIARGSPEQRQLDYTNYIAGYYAGARSTAPVAIDDDRANNVIEIREYYSLPRAFTDDDDGVLSFFLHADELYSYGEALNSSVREAPLALEYPVHVRQNLIVHLPEAWPIKPETVTVENPAFRYRSDIRYSDLTLQLNYEYQALADHVTLEQLPQYETDRARFYDDTGYSLTHDTDFGKASPLALAPTIAMLMAFGLSGWGAVRWGWRYDPEPRESPSGAPAGIRGWLLLPALTMVIAPFVFVWAIAAWVPMLNSDSWLGIVAEEYRSSAQSILMAILIAGVALVAGTLLVAVLFFTKRSSAPAAFIVWSWLAVSYWAVVWGLLILSGFEADTADYARQTVRDVLSSVIWTAYMLKSKRVRATFVKRSGRKEITDGDLIPGALVNR
jgi:transglutaminase-like putative cysteine protease